MATIMGTGHFTKILEVILMLKSAKLKQQLVEAQRLFTKDQSNTALDNNSDKVKNRQKEVNRIQTALARIESGEIGDTEVGQQVDNTPNEGGAPGTVTPTQPKVSPTPPVINWSKSQLELFGFVKAFISHVTLLSGLGVSIELPDSIDTYLLLGLNIRVIKLIANQISELASKSDDINKVYGQLMSLTGDNIKRSDFKELVYSYVLGICFTFYWELANCVASENFDKCGDKSTMVGGQTFVFLDHLRNIVQFDGTAIPMFGRFINFSAKLVPVEQLFSSELCELLEDPRYRLHMRSVNEILIRMLSDKVRFVCTEKKSLSGSPFGCISFGSGLMWISNS
jgi:hypothetical protein